jgi:hypothetical protein
MVFSNGVRMDTVLNEFQTFVSGVKGLIRSNVSCEVVETR